MASLLTDDFVRANGLPADPAAAGAPLARRSLHSPSGRHHAGRLRESV
jgi:hypothetical protein